MSDPGAIVRRFLEAGRLDPARGLALDAYCAHLDGRPPGSATFDDVLAFADALIAGGVDDDALFSTLQAVRSFYAWGTAEGLWPEGTAALMVPDDLA